MNSAGVKIIALHKESNCIMSNITIESKKNLFFSTGLYFSISSTGAIINISISTDCL